MSYASSIRRGIDQLKSSEDIEEILKMAQAETVRAVFFDHDKLDHWVEVCEVAEEALEAPSLHLQTSMPSYALAA